MSARDDRFVINPKSQACHPGLDPGSPKRQVVSAIPKERFAFSERPQRVSVRGGRRRSSEAGAALIFCLLLDQAKSS